MASGDAGSTLIREQFSVANERVDLQMLAWSDYVGRILDVPISRAHVKRGFDGQIETFVLDGLIYLDSRTDPVSQERTLARISTDNMTDFCFHVAVEGIADTQTLSSHQRKSTQYVPGILALDMSQPMLMKRPTRARVLAFFFPRSVVNAAIPEAESIHGQVLGYTSPLTMLLRQSLLDLCDELPGMAPAEAERALRTCAGLILAAFGKQARASGQVRAAARDAMLGRIKHYIHGNLHRRDLTPDNVLSMFPLARPTLYRMFEHEGGLHAYIRNSRLRQAADELAQTAPVPIAQIASRLGFRYASDFTRAFRRAYGMAPAEFGAMKLEWLTL
ncbi:AraC-like DNA-binding protein [Luteibacter sp. Sphag1AF]|uniref:helix-turn-helix domain-containing protein n=1 Tax=Luteibacter sp. Sphag1AF TaxID=2587031 RepID=UPI0017E0A157|nr:helix-turn-helix domain-containing protein [Luteibacter sp. Sphag1AF]MBB3226350.1 AraC-like DNA-binding protein [Luteibacter sp. Sphag1AF]